MAWSSLTSNQWVTGADLAGAGFTVKNAGAVPPSNNQWVTRAQALAGYNITAITSDNRWVTKGELNSSGSNVVTLTPNYAWNDAGQYWYGYVNASATVNVTVNINFAYSFTDANDPQPFNVFSGTINLTLAAGTSYISGVLGGSNLNVLSAGIDTYAPTTGGGQVFNKA